MYVGEVGGSDAYDEERTRKAGQAGKAGREYCAGTDGLLVSLIHERKGSLDRSFGWRLSDEMFTYVDDYVRYIT
jgi:hypothetical protein